MSYSKWSDVKRPKTAYDAHKILRKYDLDIIEISVVKVNPKNNTIEDDSSLNTEIRVWIEIGYDGPSGGWENEGLDKYDFISYHHYKMDAGGRTFEEALIKSARKAQKLYK